MFLIDLITLVFAWGLFILSGKFFPTLNHSLSAMSDWATFIFFKPLHLLLSLFCFLSALVLIRMVTLKYGKQLFGAVGVARKSQRIFGLTHLLLGLWILSLIVLSYPLAAGLLGGGMAIYDVSRYLFSARRKKRLKMALRELQE
ncbi:hypothetical protein BEP19_01670 [Ammoniphilus oxalaticus]|uniref:Uncharacterized protein n=1 Tax=Ammoniphilus oxalaticus TaxID=66863 RepID=A0A419SMZ5_9BACL|nr:hypothetical protein [Ammoniphilus oxalaticus]RKD25676.1 hypothetical protein BEP19_01670 [Ammoniphilus oxalaticus]